MRLNDLEKNILKAERDYRSIDDKLNYVNLRMKYSIINSEKQVQIVHPKSLIKKDTYYRKVGELENKSKVRANNILKSMLPELVNEHDTLLEDRIELREMLERAKADQKHMAGARLKMLQIEMGQRIFAVKQNIATLMERPQVESGDHIEQQIRLLTTL